MKKLIYSFLALSCFSIFFTNSYAETINGKSYNNLDKIEVTGYYHPSELYVESPGGMLDWKYTQSGLWKYPEHKALVDNVGKLNIFWGSVSLWILNNTQAKRDENGNYSESNGYTYVESDTLNKTSDGEFLLLLSKDFESNILKNPIFAKDLSPEWTKNRINAMRSILQFNNGNVDLRKNKIKIIGKYYRLKWHFVFEDKNLDLPKEEKDLDLNIILVDDISTDMSSNSSNISISAPSDTKATQNTPVTQKTKQDIIKEKAKVYEDRISYIISNTPWYMDKSEKIDKFIQVLSSGKYKTNPLAIELVNYLQKMKDDLDSQPMDINWFFN